MLADDIPDGKSLGDIMRFELGNGYCLRSFLYGDALSIAEHGNNVEVARTLRDSFPNPYTIEHARVWIRHVKEHESDTRFIIACNDEAVGEIGFVIQTDVHRYTAEIGYWLSQEHWGKGVMSKAVETIGHYAFEKFDVVRLFADVVKHNYGSCKVLERCGYNLEGVFRNNIYKDGQFYDHLVYALVRDI
ncbi:GNAT family N-acetyltransferase [Endozoicomonas sp. Mp262]|uniref:GNAT family N-acetyltransferase n=1 Tax=Endozoicomonas sp. Mp262 TaxID=2919499 RepID=UPI0021DFDC1C